jgi:hypothetical protein
LNTRSPEWFNSANKSHMINKSILQLYCKLNTIFFFAKDG